MDRLALDTEISRSKLQNLKEEADKKRERELLILREKEQRRLEDQIKRKQEELRKKLEKEENRKLIQKFKLEKERIRKENEEKERKRLEEERKLREFEKKGYVPYDIRLRYLLGSVSSGETKVGSNIVQVHTSARPFA